MSFETLEALLLNHDNAKMFISEMIYFYLTIMFAVLGCGMIVLIDTELDKEDLW